MRANEITRERDIDAALETASRCREDASIYRQLGFDTLARWLTDNAKAAVDQMNLTIKAETAAKNKQAVAEYKIRLAEMKADHKELDKRLKLLKWYDEQYKKAAEKIREAKLKAAIESNDDDEDYDE